MDRPAPLPQNVVMSQLNERERQRIQQGLRDLPGPVVLRYYTSDVDSWYSRSERALLEEIAGASARITLEVHADRWDPAREAAVGIRRTPALAISGARDTRVRYYGVPDGYELEVFLAFLRAVAGGPPALSAASTARLRGLTRPVLLEVLASPT
jgi:alkyl hydroperoxide reductase subunit AhpF